MSLSFERFPVLRSLPQYSPKEREELRRCPESVPWTLVAKHRQRAIRNHGQPLETLARRGGLDPFELLALITDKPWRAYAEMPLKDVLDLLLERLDDE